MKKASKWLIPAGIVAGVVVLALGLFFLFRSLRGGDPVAQYQRVEKAHVDAALAGSKKLNSQSLSVAADEFYLEGDLGLSVDTSVIGSDVMDLVEGLAGVDLSWFKNVDVAFTAGQDKGWIGGTTGIKLNSVSLANAEYLFDQEKGLLYLLAPILSDKAVELNYEELNGETWVPLTSSLDMSALPNDEDVNKLIGRYADLVIESVKTVEKTEETVTLTGAGKDGELSQKLTVLKVTLTNEEILEISKKIVDKAVEDKDLEKIFIACADGMKLGDSKELYASFQTALKDARKELDTVDLSEFPENLTMLVYVNKNDEICGRELLFSQNDKVVSEFGYRSVRDGDKYALNAHVEAGDSMLDVKGGGTVDTKRDQTSGTFDIKFRGGGLVLDIGTVDVMFRESKDGMMYRIDLTPSDAIRGQLMNMLGMSLPEPLNKLISNAGIRWRGESGKDGSKSAVALCVNKEEAITVYLSLKEVSPWSLKTFSDSVSMEEYEATADLTTAAATLLERLTEAGMPASLLGAFGGIDMELEPTDPIVEPEPEPTEAPAPEATPAPTTTTPTVPTGVPLRGIDPNSNADPAYIEANAAEYFDAENPAPFGAWVKGGMYNAKSHEYETVYWRIVSISKDALAEIEAYNAQSTWMTYETTSADPAVQWYLLTYQVYYPESWTDDEYGFASSGLSGFAKNPDGGGFPHNGVAYIGLGQLHDLFPTFSDTYHAGDLVMHTAIFDMLVEEPLYVFQLDGGQDAAGNYIDAYAASTDGSVG